jgi:hypothetical protein
MGISIQHNPNGSVTVSCGSDSLTFVPNGASASGGPAVIPIVDTSDDPLRGWDLPGANVASPSVAAGKFPGLGFLRVRVDPLSGRLRWGENERASFESYAAGLPSGHSPDLGIVCELGHPMDIGPLTSQLRQIQAQMGRRITPYLTAEHDTGSTL